MIVVFFVTYSGQNRLCRQWRCVASGKVSWCAKEERGEETFLMCYTSRTFIVHHISNFQFATHIEFSICNKYWNFNLEQILNFSMCNKSPTSSVQHILNVELSICNKYQIFNMKSISNIVLTASATSWTERTKTYSTICCCNVTGQSFLKRHKFISLLLKKTGPVHCRCVCSRMLLSLSVALSLSTAFQFYCAGSGVVKFSISVKWKISKATYIKKVCMN